MTLIYKNTVRVFVSACDAMPPTTWDCVRAHVGEHVYACGHVQLQAVYSADIISMSTQRWVVLISFPSMPFKQHGNHGGGWIWNKFPMHWCGVCSSCVLTHTWQIQHFDSNFSASLMVYSPGRVMSFCVWRYSWAAINKYFNSLSNISSIIYFYIINNTIFYHWIKSEPIL